MSNMEMGDLVSNDDTNLAINQLRLNAKDRLIYEYNEAKSVGEAVSDNLNGLLLLSTYIPEEVLVYVLGNLNCEDLLSCRLVCQMWRHLIDDVVCFKKINARSKEVFPESHVQLLPHSLPIYVSFAILRGSIGSNILKNAFGSDKPKFKHWKLHRSYQKAWIIESEPAGSDPLPEHLPERSCFATTYIPQAKQQLIWLSKNGLNDKLMDEIQPDIEVSEWIARRFDCGAEYYLDVQLLNSKKEVVHAVHLSRGNLEDTHWHKVAHTFKNYGPGVRYVLFRHQGKDTQFWAGHYGCKMAGGSVVAKLPASLIDRAHTDYSSS